ncbi:DNA-binding protein [Hymenobacter taeanensis]|uniref:DNA-binding protein n=1 Tax=Hymenobacter taeanensis TaxID=2735321 RepID=A0A6M6BDZ6_9BACT|nr:MULTISPECIES: PPC domain-containing DNA-binding protein [Hymenobacter]QJX46088.1 DNA-binding protein [Hymenobacter taeanensis]UOQ79942.1 DNA-binding protein [Hymenobacter sp. 5414T-23]
MIQFLLTGLLALQVLVASAQSAPAMSARPLAVSSASSPMRAHALRLHPGDDLRQQLLRFVEGQHLKAGAVLTCVGSLTTTTLRLANQEGPTVYHGHFEIVSLVGTLSVNGSHLHLSVADSTGRTIGGHLLDGNIIYTTAEIVLGELPELDFRRETDATYGYKELSVHPADDKPRKAPRAGRK